MNAEEEEEEEEDRGGGKGDEKGEEHVEGIPVTREREREGHSH